MGTLVGLQAGCAHGQWDFMAPPGSRSSARLSLGRAVPLSPQVPRPCSPCCSDKSFFFFFHLETSRHRSPRCSSLQVTQLPFPPRPIPCPPSRSPYLAAGGAAPRRRGGRRGARPAPSPPPSPEAGAGSLSSSASAPGGGGAQVGPGGHSSSCPASPGAARAGCGATEPEEKERGGRTHRPPPRTPPTRAARPKPHPAWTRAPPGMGRPRLLWQPSASAALQ